MKTCRLKSLLKPLTFIVAIDRNDMIIRKNATTIFSILCRKAHVISLMPDGLYLLLLPVGKAPPMALDLPSSGRRQPFESAGCELGPSSAGSAARIDLPGPSLMSCLVVPDGRVGSGRVE